MTEAEGVRRGPLSERTRPESLADLVGNQPALEELERWAASWRDGPAIPRLRAAILQGPPGVGKTSAALALAHDMGWNVVELNASDARNERAIQQVAGRAALSHSLSGEAPRASHGRGRVLILLDEADCLSGRATETAPRRAAPAGLRDFLQGRYGSVEALNGAWGLGQGGAPAGFLRWDQLPNSPGRAAWARLGPARRDLADWQGATEHADSGDRGGLGAIARLVRETRQPLLLTVNDVTPLTRYSPVFRTGVARIRFDPLSPSEMRQVVRRVVGREGLTLAAAAMEAIVQRSRGDVRAAMNDLEAVAPLPRGIAPEGLLLVRDSTAEIAEFVSDVLAQPRFYRGAEVRDRLDATPDDILPWVEENLPRRAPDARSRHDAFETLDRAEQMLARARRHRVYGLWSFATEIMTGGVSLTLDARGEPGGEAAFPVFLGEMGRSRASRASRQSILGKVGRGVHLSRRKANESAYPLLEQAFRGGRGPARAPGEGTNARRLVGELKLTPEDVAFLLGAEPDSAAVARFFGVTPKSGPEGTAEASSAPGKEPAGEERPPAKRPRLRRQRSLGDF